MVECKVWQKVCGQCWLSALPADLYGNPASAFVAQANAKWRQKTSSLDVKVSSLSLFFKHETNWYTGTGSGR